MIADIPVDSLAFPLSLRLFGPPEVRVLGRPLPPLRSRKALWLLALLALRQGREVERAWIAGNLWPESGGSQALHNLRVTLTDLRHALGSEAGRVRSPQPRILSLDLSGVQADLPAFDEAMAKGNLSGYERAVALYNGVLLEGCNEEWVFQERERREADLLHALKALADHSHAMGDYNQAGEYYQRALSIDPFKESLYRDLMICRAREGNASEAIHLFRQLRELLHRELHQEPSPETRDLFERIRAEGRTSAWSPPAALPSAPPLAPDEWEPAGGAVPLASPYYVRRAADDLFHSALNRRDSIVLLKGCRQIGKSSLLARGLQQAREAGMKVALVSLESLGSDALTSTDRLFKAFMNDLVDQLDLEACPQETWKDHLSPNVNFERFLRREVLDKLSVPFVWGLDDVDRLFETPDASEVFGLFRSWHNKRSLDPQGPWSRLTLAIAYATEAHLFITDVNQSPFAVGTQVTLEDFTREETAELNRRHGSPLQTEGEIAQFYALVGGHPLLIRQGLLSLASRSIETEELVKQGSLDEGVFSSHLRRILSLLRREPELSAVLKGMLRGQPCPNLESFYRLRSAGILAGETTRDARLRCPLYAAYLDRHLPAGG